jgi:hypothetical protein
VIANLFAFTSAAFAQQTSPAPQAADRFIGTWAADSRKFNVLSAWSLIHTQNTNERTYVPDR